MLRKRWFGLLLTGALLVAVGLKFRLIHFYGTDLPSGDQWTGEAEAVLQPYLHDKLEWRHLLAPHNEHRIVLTRFWNLLLYTATGQWDARVQMTANVFLHLGSLALLLGMLRGRLSALSLSLVGALTVFLFSTSATWENTLSGFQSQFYFLLLLSLVHVLGTLAWPQGTPRWWCAQVAGAINPLTMAGAVVAPLTVLLALAYERWGRGERRRGFPGLIAWNVGLAVCCWLLIADAPGHAQLRPATAWERLHAVLHVLSWPVLEWKSAALIYLPSFVYLLQAWRGRRTAKADLLPWALVLFAAMHAVALAVARGGVASRYMDVLALGIIANAVCWFLLKSNGRVQQLQIVAAAVWTMLVIHGVKHWEKVGHEVTLGPRAAFDSERASGIRRYLETGEASHLRSPALQTDADPVVLEQLLRDPLFADALPASTRNGITLRTGTPTVFSAERLPVRLANGSVPHPRGVFGVPDTQVRSYESEPITAPGVVVSLWVTGEVTPPRSSLTLRDAGGNVVYPLDGGAVKSPDRWKRVNFPVVDGPFQVIAEAGAGAVPFAFSEPVELPRLSWATSRLLKSWPVWFWTGFVLLATSTLFVTSDWLREPPPKKGKT